jgi:hypothetical protein
MCEDEQKNGTTTGDPSPLDEGMEGRSERYEAWARWYDDGAGSSHRLTTESHEARRTSTEQRTSTERRTRRPKEKRSRLTAILVLVAVAVVVVFAGVTGIADGDGDVRAVPFSVLPVTPEFAKEGNASSTSLSSGATNGNDATVTTSATGTMDTDGP